MVQSNGNGDLINLSVAISLFLLLFVSNTSLWAETEAGYIYRGGDYIGEINGGDVGDLARAVQNPIADLISVPLQNNTNFNVGPREKTQNVLNIQPVVPVDLSDDWMMITRTIAPIVSQPAFTTDGDRENGLGDTTFSAFFSPKKRELWLGDWLWGGRTGSTVAYQHR